MSSTSTTWTTDTNTKSGTVQVYEGNVSVLRILGIEGGNAILDLFADQGDDNADKWRMWVNASDDDLHFANYTSGAWANLLTIQDGGNVGIGTDSPAYALQLKGDSTYLSVIAADGSAAVLLGSDGSGDGNLTLKDHGGNNKIYLSGESGADNYFNNSGNVGIGTDDPDVPLDVNGAVLGGLKANTTSYIAMQRNDAIVGGMNTQSGVLNLFAGTDTEEQHLTIRSSGKIGIGTDNPNALLEVAGGSDGYGEIIVSSDSASNIQLFDNDALIGGMNTQSGKFNLFAGTNEWAQHLTILSSGRVGIGYGSPLDVFHVKSAEDATGSILLESWGSASDDHPRLRLARAKSTGDLAVDDGQSLGAIEFLGYMGSNGDYYTNYESGAIITAVVDGEPSNSNEDMPCELQFWTRDDGGVSLSQNMTIRGSGNVGIGTISPLRQLQVESDNTSRADSNQGCFAFYATSDYGSMESIFSHRQDANAIVVNEGGNDLDFRIESDTLTHAFFVQGSDGFVGIGTSSPGSSLPDSLSATTPALLEIQSVSASTDSGILLRRSDGAVGLDLWQDGSGGAVYIDNRYNDVNGEIHFRTKTSATPIEAMMIDGDGKVGIGTSSPDYNLEIEASGTFSKMAQTVYRDSDKGNYQDMFFSRGAVGSPAVVQDDDELFTLRAFGYNADGTAFDQAGAIIFSVDGTPSSSSDSSDMPGRIEFWTSPDGTETPTEKMVIKNTGHVGIGVSNPTSLLEIQSSATHAQLTLATFSETNDHSGILTFKKSGNATKGSYTVTADDETLGDIRFYGTDSGPSESALSAWISCYQDGAAGSTYIPSRLVFATGTDAASATERMRIDSSGNVGIGNTNPNADLHVGMFSTSNQEFRIESSDNAYFSVLTEGSLAKVYAGAASTGDNELAFYTSDGGTEGERVRIDEEGNVGIGTSSPGSLLEVRGPAGDDFACAGILTLSTAELGIISGDVLGAILFQAPLEHATDGNEPSAAIWGEAEGIYDAADNKGSLVFATSNSETAFASAQERMRIDNEGNVGIGTDGPDGKLVVVGGSAVDERKVKFKADNGEERFEFHMGASGNASNLKMYDDAAVQKIHLSTASDSYFIGGGVGIGTTSPGSLLEVRGTTGTDFSCAGELRLSTAETTVIDGDVLGMITFQAPLEGTGSDAILPSAAIWCEASVSHFDADENDGDIVFATANSETAIAYAQERMRIDSDGNVGIGTATPTNLLTVEGNPPTTSALFVLRNTGTGTTDDIYMGYNRDDSDGSDGWSTGVDSQANTFCISEDADTLANDVRLAILAGGNVGIGTTSPGADLDIEDTTASSATQGGSLRLGSNDGAVMGDGHRLGVIEFVGAEDTSSTMTVGARIEAKANATWSDTENSGYLSFLTTNGDAVQSEVLRLKDNKDATFYGNVGIGLTPTANMVGLSIEAGCLTLKERATPTADTNYGKIYTKTDNKLYFQDGAGTEHEIAFV